MKLKKLLVTLLAITTMVVPMNFPSVSAYGEVQNSELYARRYSLFGKLGLLSKNVDYTSENTNVTRADFIMAALRFNAKDNVSAVSGNPFVDVLVDDPVAPYVKKGVELGYLSGYSDGEFRPNDPIRIEQAIKVIVKMLGYAMEAEAAGGYPNGYITIADSYGVLEDVVVSKGAFMTYGEMLRLFENAMDVEVPELKASGTAPSINYETETTFLEAHHRIFKEDGIVDGNDVTALKTGSVTKKGLVTIDGKKFYAGRTDIVAELGMAVDIYYRQQKDADIGTVLHYSVDIDCQTIVIDDIDLYKKNDAYSYTYYDERDRKHTIPITDATNVIYNGKLKPFYKKADLNPAYGQIKLIDNNNDEIFEVISIFDIQQTVIAGTVSQTDSYITISDAIQKSNSFQISKNGDIDYLILSNGTTIAPTSIKSGDVLSIGATDEYVMIQVANDPVVGTLQSKLADNYVVIDASQYKAQDIFVNLTETTPSMTGLKIGISATYRRDFMGQIVGVDNTKGEVTGEYAYLFKIYQHVNEENQVKLRFMKADGKIYTYPLAEFVTVNGKRKQEPYQAVEALKAYNKVDVGRNNSNAPDYPDRQMFKFIADENDVITHIWIATDKPEDNFRYEGSYTAKKSYDVYRRPNADVGSWGRSWYYEPTSRIFCIYPNEENCFTTNFYNYNLSVLKRTAGDPRTTAYFYDRTDALVIGVALVYCPGSTGGDSSSSVKNTTSEEMGQYYRMHAVTKVYEGLDENEEPATIVEATSTYDGTKVKISATEDTNDYIREQLKITKPGDIVQYKYNDIDQLVGYRRLFMAENYGDFGAVRDTKTGNVHWGNWTPSFVGDTTVDEKECIEKEDAWIDLAYQSWLYSTAQFVDGTRLVYKNYYSNETNMIPTQNTTEAIAVARINISNPKNIVVESGLSLDVITPGCHFIIMTSNNIGSNGIVVIEK